MTTLPRDASLPLADFIEPFLSPARGLSVASRQDYGRYLRDFDDFTGKRDLRAALTLENAKGFREYLRNKGLSTSRNGTMVLKSFARWLHANGILIGPGGDTILALLKAHRAPKSKRATFSDEELASIWTLLDSRSKGDRLRAMAAVRLMSASGLRRDEIRNVLYKDITFDTSGGWLIVRSQRKGMQPRVRLDTDTTAALLAYYAEERPDYTGRPPDPVFLREEGKGLTKNGFATWLDRIGREIEEGTGLKWTAELMRQTWIVNQKVPLRDPELRSHCMVILDGDGNYDQAVMAACRVLETRVRVASRAPESHRSGATLMRYAFGTDGPLQLTDDPSEQKGAMEMFTGVMTFYRNPAMHRVRDDLDRHEALRIVSWIDHLLTLVGRAERLSYARIGLPVA